MSAASVSYDFNGTPVGLIPHDGDLWVKTDDIGGCLGYSDGSRSVMKIYNRNREELDPHTCVVKLTTQGRDGVEQRRTVRVFNEEGVMIITMLSRQPKAAEFRAWAVKVLKAYRRGELAMTAPPQRDHLLELCIIQAGYGNVAAMDTLIGRYGYRKEIKQEQMKLVALRYGKGNPMLLEDEPPIVGWFIDNFLPNLEGNGPYIEALDRSGVWEDGSIVASTSDLLAAIIPLAESAGVSAEINPRLFGEWLLRGLGRLEQHGWARSVAATTHGIKRYRLARITTQ